MTFHRSLIRSNDRLCRQRIKNIPDKNRDLPAGPMPLLKRSRRREKEMRALMASLIALAILYFWDKEGNDGKLLDGLDRMRRSITQTVAR